MSLDTTLLSSLERPETAPLISPEPLALDGYEAHRLLARAALDQIAPRLDLSCLMEARALRRPSAPVCASVPAPRAARL